MDEMAEYDLISGKFKLSIRKIFHPLTLVLAQRHPVFTEAGDKLLKICLLSSY